MNWSIEYNDNTHLLKLAKTQHSALLWEVQLAVMSIQNILLEQSTRVMYRNDNEKL